MKFLKSLPLVIVGILIGIILGLVFAFKNADSICGFGRTVTQPSVQEHVKPRVEAPAAAAPRNVAPRRPKKQPPASTPVPMERPPADNSVPAVPEQQSYFVAPPKSGRVIGPRDVRGLYTISSVEVAPETSTLTIKVRVISRAKPGFSIMVTAGDFKLIHGGPAIELGQHFTHHVASGESMDIELAFVIPPGLTQATLSIQNFSDSASIPLNLAPPPPPQSPSQSNEAV